MLSGVTTIDQSTYTDVLDFSVRTGGNVMVFGPAGVGKSEVAMQRATAAGFKYVYLNLSVLEAPDLVGLPKIDEKTDTSKYCPPDFIPLYNEKEPQVILIADEVDKAKPELQNPMLELFQFRSINGRKTNIHSVIATGNLPDENAFSQPVSHALTNRCSVYKLDCAFDPWHHWAVQSQVNPLVVGFLSRNIEYLMRQDNEEDPTAYCKCSPRSWTLAARDLDHTTSHHSVGFQTMLVAGRVGTGAAIKFQVWLEHYRYIEPYIDALLRDGTHPSGEATKDTARTLVCAIAGANAIMQKCRNTPTKDADKEKLRKEIHRLTSNVCNWCNNLSPDICIAAFKSVFTIDAINEHKLTQVPAFMSVFLKIKSSLGT